MVKNNRPADAKPLRTKTRLAHGGFDPAGFHGFVNPPVVHASTVLFPDTQTHQTRNQKYVYGRRGTPTTDALSAIVSELEGADDTVLTPSGLSACIHALMSTVQAGDRVLVVDNSYAPTRTFCDNVLKRFGVETVYFDPLDEDAFAVLLKEPTAAVQLEAPGTNTFEMPDVPKLAAMAKEAGAMVVMDNTWATPLFFRPLDHGVDLSVQAATKYFGGHSDLLLGTIAGNGEAIAKVRADHGFFGINVGPDDVFATLRGIRTLAVRLEAHQQNALMVAEWLDSQSAVHRVLYPALPGSPGYETWKRTFKGATGLFAITFKGCPHTDVAQFINSLSLFGIGASWGGYESLALLQPVQKVRTATQWPADEHVVRLHIGLEDPRDLIEDLDRALNVAFGH